MGRVPEKTHICRCWELRRGAPRLGRAWRGEAVPGAAKRGKETKGKDSSKARQGKAGLGGARQSKARILARLGTAMRCRAWLGNQRQGKDFSKAMARQGTARQGEARPGPVGHGTQRKGKDFSMALIGAAKQVGAIQTKARKLNGGIQ